MLPANNAPSYFAVLALPEPSPSLPRPSDLEIKTAYKKALLLHHPDKSSSPKPTQVSYTPTIDQITQAYRVLSSTHSREAYMRNLLASRASLIGPLTNKPELQPSVDVVDLSDMQHDEKELVYYRSCRCGRQKSYLVSERELEKRIEDGEVDVGCDGCSLLIRVEFGVTNDDSGG